MVVLNIAVIASDELARSIAKAADQRDVHTYVHKENGPEGARILSLIRPAKYPERLPPFLNALSTSQAGIIEVTAVDASLGEVLVAFASAGIKRGLAIINPAEGGWIDEDQVNMLFKQAGLASWTFEANDGVHLRERMYALMDDIQGVLEANAKAPLVLPVDQHFNVKGIAWRHWLRSIGQVSVRWSCSCKPTGRAIQNHCRSWTTSTSPGGHRPCAHEEDHLTGGTIIVHPVEDKRANLSVPLAVEQHQLDRALTTSPFQKRVLAGDIVHASVNPVCGGSCCQCTVKPLVIGSSPCLFEKTTLPRFLSHSSTPNLASWVQPCWFRTTLDGEPPRGDFSSSRAAPPSVV